MKKSDINEIIAALLFIFIREEDKNHKTVPGEN